MTLCAEENRSLASRVSPALKLPKSGLFILHIFLLSNEDELENNVDMF